MQKNLGIHHITAIVGDPQENADFYARVLGLRLVKQTVNFDDPGTYHLYFGNQNGEPGTILTFFPWEHAYQGKIGAGQVGAIAFAVPEGSLPFWKERLSKHGISYDLETRFEEERLLFDDPHGLHLEITERAGGNKSSWEIDGITEDTAIKGFAGAVLLSAAPHKTADLLENTMGFVCLGQDNDTLRFQSESDLANIIDIKLIPVGRSMMGVGTVHHIAFRAKDSEDLENWKALIDQSGLQATPVLDRKYFTSIYFREEGGILFEMATDPPGFEADEPFNELGSSLMLPDWLEEKRQEITNILKPITIPKGGFSK
ncbi:ring-cleaving dioxygenase [Metabacillus sp. GX 13764]|uniref:ring-cleaving dioxygenase n=1 Tax=Metabacillus kandeliae TaxID=2900151 RepID=UPI001E60C176|nr:ring-cleaving dioxygenase [Metabacillus kandeliae]MCD7035913.1 ring-cleaving dioxygenase [Metabacillus kandeliae]